jgi:hypothetical protein
MAKKKSASALISDLKRKTRKAYSSEEKIRIIIEGVRGEMSIAVTVTDYCGRISYNSYVLTIMPPARVITNRRITYRVNPN